ncbi:MAG: Fur family transcriptional regulator [Candidatus Cloacimonadota bacterium]|nr:Fur family transcriptional regulator [Candidatus Cloacimonadota bacterium]
MKKEEIIFRNFLKSKGLKLTQPRRIILNTVFSTHEHFNVDALYDIIRKKHKNVSRATIYRTMPLLIEAGLIKQALRCQAKDHYEHIFGHRSHLHFICDKCGKIIEKESKDVERLIKKLAADSDFTIREFNVGAKGLCKGCR